MKKKGRVKDNLRIVLVTTTVLLFITITGFYLFNLYINIDISNPKSESSYEVTRTSRNSRRNKKAR